MEPWGNVAVPCKEVREDCSFNADDFAIQLEQVVAGTGPDDYKEPEHFFARTCFTRALQEHNGVVLRRPAGETANTAPVMTLVTQFGNGKTHMLASRYRL
jgi:predicted AAA+ superfamily ATPase